MKLVIFVFLILLFPKTGCSQLQYPIVGEYKGKSAQGLAIYGAEAFLMNDGGICRKLNLQNGVVEKEFNLACSVYKPHINAVCFSNTFIRSDKYPLLYVSEFKKPFRCFVERLSSDSSITIQQIKAMNGKKAVAAMNWVVDNGGYIYAITRDKNKCDDNGQYLNTFYKYKKPGVDKGAEITLTNDDLVDSFRAYFSNALQGAKIKDDCMYILTGFHEMLNWRKEYNRALIVINLKTKKIIRKIDLSYVTTNEPEDIDFYRSECLMFCGQNGGIYSIGLK